MPTQSPCMHQRAMFRQALEGGDAPSTTCIKGDRTRINIRGRERERSAETPCFPLGTQKIWFTGGVLAWTRSISLSAVAFSGSCARTVFASTSASSIFFNCSGLGAFFNHHNNYFTTVFLNVFACICFYKLGSGVLGFLGKNSLVRGWDWTVFASTSASSVFFNCSER